MVSDATLHKLIANSEDRWGRPFTTAADIADVVDMSRHGVYKRLEQLARRGEIKKYQPGQSTIWFVDD
jgi:DNA-binding Lrp family transcriptional regulator